MITFCWFDETSASVLLQDKEKKKKESIFDLSKYIDKTIRVKFQGGREGTWLMLAITSSFIFIMISYVNNKSKCYLLIYHQHFIYCTYAQDYLRPVFLKPKRLKGTNVTSVTHSVSSCLIANLFNWNPLPLHSEWCPERVRSSAEPGARRYNWVHAW